MPKAGDRSPQFAQPLPVNGEVSPQAGGLFPRSGEPSPGFGELFPSIGEIFPQLPPGTVEWSNGLDLDPEDLYELSIPE